MEKFGMGKFGMEKFEKIQNSDEKNIKNDI